MKFNFKYSSLILLSLTCLMLSCSEELEEEPKSLVVENFYSNASEVETATNAIYSPLRSGRTMSTYEATLECLSDFVYGRGSWTQIGEFGKLNDTNINRVSQLWSSFYTSILRANLVIKNSPIDDAKVNVFVAEAKFLRAFLYYQLVRNWGGVPLRTEANMSEINVPRATIADVYDFILKDIIDAEANLPEKREAAGRPSKLAAKTLLADVYLQLGEYDKARNKAAEVIDSKEFSLIPVKSKEDFQEKVFGPTLISTSEEIFYLKYSNILAGQENYMLWIVNHASTGGFPFGGAYAIHGYLTNPIYQTWDDKDIRKQLWSNVSFGLGPNTLVSTKFIDREAITKDGGANDDPVYGYSDLLFIFAEASIKANGRVTQEAVDAVNQIHRRAYGQDPLNPSDCDFKLRDYNSVDSFMNVIIKERGYEFQLEGKRWLELKRTGLAKEIVKEAKDKDVSDICFLWPIPINEMNNNKALDPSRDQNPGY